MYVFADALIFLSLFPPQMHYRFRCLTQRELNRAYEGPEFELADKYGEHLGIVFVTMLFSSGMPILYLAAGLSFYVTYMLEKWYILQVNGLFYRFVNERKVHSLAQT